MPGTATQLNSNSKFHDIQLPLPLIGLYQLVVHITAKKLKQFTNSSVYSSYTSRAHRREVGWAALIIIPFAEELY